MQTLSSVGQNVLITMGGASGVNSKRNESSVACFSPQTTHSSDYEVCWNETICRGRGDFRDMGNWPPARNEPLAQSPVQQQRTQRRKPAIQRRKTSQGRQMTLIFCKQQGLRKIVNERAPFLFGSGTIDQLSESNRLYGVERVGTRPISRAKKSRQVIKKRLFFFPSSPSFLLFFLLF